MRKRFAELLMYKGRGAIDSKIHELCHLRHPRFDCSNGMSVSGEQSQMARSESKLSNSCVLVSVPLCLSVCPLVTTHLYLAIILAVPEFL